MSFNLVVSTFRHREENAKAELLDILEKLKDPRPKSEVTRVAGLVLGHTALNPFEIIRRFREIIQNEPWQIRFILRLIPIESVVSTELESIKNSAKELASKMYTKDTFKIKVEKRHTFLTSSEVIEAIAKEIGNTVNLGNPDWIILVEIIEGQAGVSVLRPNEIFSSVVEKRNSIIL